MPRPARPLLTHLGLGLAVLAMLGAPLRALGAAHCDALGADGASAHSGQHHAQGEPSGTGTEDKGSHGGCPHCPPVECAQQLTCVQLVSDMAAAAPDEVQPGITHVPVPFGAVYPVACTVPPPTPPPQQDA